MHDESTSTIGLHSRRKAQHCLRSRTSQGHCISTHSDVTTKHTASRYQKKKTAGRAETRSTPKESPLAEPQSNGHVKSAVMEVTGMIRSVSLRSCDFAQNGNAKHCKPWVRTSQVSRSSRAILDETTRGDARKWSPNTP